MPVTYHPGRNLLCPLLLCSVSVHCSLAQDHAASSSLYSIVITDAAIALEDGLSFWSAPVRFSGEDWMIAGGTAAGVIGVMSIDGDLRGRLGTEAEEDLGNSFWNAPTSYGDLRYAGLFSAGTYAVGLFAGDQSIRVTGRLILESFALSGSALMIIRYIAGRDGPNGDATPWDFRGFQWNNAGQSFPSGHTTVAFALSTVLAERIDHPLARIGLYGMASLTAFARVRYNQHWTSDVLVGAMLGIAAGLHVVAEERERECATGRPEGLSIMPGPCGVRLQYTF